MIQENSTTPDLTLNSYSSNADSKTIESRNDLIQLPDDQFWIDDIDTTEPDGGVLSYLLGAVERNEIRPSNEIIPGLCRGEVGLLVSPTNQGKTTLLRNITADIIAGRDSGPFGGYEFVKNRMVYFLDFEDALPKALNDFKQILGNDIGKGADQLHLMVKPMFFDEIGYERQWREGYFDRSLAAVHEVPLSLSQPKHRDHIVERIKDRAQWGWDPCFLIVDTVASGFVIDDENDASTVANTVMKPLADIAKRANVAILAAIHESTKAGTNRKASAPHKIRGSSVFGDLARAIYQLTFDEETGEHELRLTKGKGIDFKPRRLKLEGRRFTVLNDFEIPATPYQRVRGLLQTGEFSPTEIGKELDLPKRSVERILEAGAKSGGFVKVRRGIYTAK